MKDDELAALVAEQLPGWQLSESRERGGVRAKVQCGPSVADLERKYGVAASRSSSTRPPDRVTTVVRPTSGGPGKVADVVNGRVVIAQG